MELKTEAELKKLAWDIHAGKVFTNRHIREGDERLFPNIFMVTLFLDEKQKEDLADAGLFYEYYDQAGPRAINGYPMFMSLRSLCKEDTEKLFDYIEEIKKLKEGFESGKPRMDNTQKEDSS